MSISISKLYRFFLFIFLFLGPTVSYSSNIWRICPFGTRQLALWRAPADIPAHLHNGFICGTRGQPVKPALAIARVSDEDYLDLLYHFKPLGFRTRSQFTEFSNQLSAVLSLLDETGCARSRIHGTATTFFSENPKKGLFHHFDRIGGSELSDIDVTVYSVGLLKQGEEWLQKNPEDRSRNYDDIFSRRQLMNQFSFLGDFIGYWTARLGREVNIIGIKYFVSGEPSDNDFVIESTTSNKCETEDLQDFPFRSHR